MNENSNNPISDEDIIDRMLQCETVEEWNNARQFAKQFRGDIWISQNLDRGLIKQVDLKEMVMTISPSASEAPVRVTVPRYITLAKGSKDLEAWYKEQIANR